MSATGAGTVPTEWPILPEPGMIDSILDIVASGTKIDRSALTPDATLDSLNIASLDMIDILFEVEEKFNVYTPMGDELSHVVYLHDLIEVLAEQIRAVPGGNQKQG
jgi:acyl carrier protein